MFISGVKVEKKKLTINVKSNSKSKPAQKESINRPYSSEYNL